ncbi:hypothetical protein Tco_1037928 [Tanacetum coccineum]
MIIALTETQRKIPVTTQSVSEKQESNDVFKDELMMLEGEERLELFPGSIAVTQAMANEFSSGKVESILHIGDINDLS